MSIFLHFGNVGTKNSFTHLTSQYFDNPSKIPFSKVCPAELSGKECFRRNLIKFSEYTEPINKSFFFIILGGTTVAQIYNNLNNPKLFVL